jgi:flagellar biosynthesis anti-sigma factor FlgM
MIENNPISSSTIQPQQPVERYTAEVKAQPVERPEMERNVDKVDVSQNARLLSKATTALNEEAEVRNEEVERITREVQNGIYEVPVKQLASALLERLFGNR